MADGAENLSGLSKLPKTRILPQGKVVGEHFKCVEGRPARATGAFGRENVGMSNRNPLKNGGLRKSQVS